MRKLFAALVIILGLAVPFSTARPALAATKVPAPPTSSPVVDQAGVINDAAEQRIATTIKNYEQQTGNQIAVLTIKDLEGEDIEGYSYRVASSWGVGNKKANNGELIVVAVQDRRVRIEVGRGLEPYLTDLQSYRIIQDYMVPEFRNGNYGRGIELGVQKSIDVIGGERLSATSKPDGMADWTSLALGAMIMAVTPLAYLASYLARSKSWWAGGLIGLAPGGVVAALSHILPGIALMVIGGGLGLLLDYLLSKNYRERKASGDDTGWWGSGGGFFGGSSGWGGGSSGGGFGGFGGGSFGGGGSSGSW